MSLEHRRVPDDDQYQFSINNCSPSLAVIEAVAWVTSRDPLDLDPLYVVIDPDALDRVVTNTDDVTVSFEMEELEVQLTSAEEIIISEC